MSETAKMLEKFEVPYEIEVTSAHRSPARTHEYAPTAGARGLKVVIVAAGGAAHLAGVVAPAVTTTLPRGRGADGDDGALRDRLALVQRSNAWRRARGGDGH